MPKKQKNITLASYNYLNEILAIPQNTRDEYLSILINRRGASSQKSVQLLKIIYNYVNENRINEWNPKLICKELKISKSMLYCHKSRLLKGLREYYFNWKETEREIEVNYKASKSGDINEAKELIELNLEKARKMAESGMRREAKKMYLALEKEVRNRSINQAEKYLIISEVCEFCAYYYFNRRQKKKLQYYINKLDYAIRAVKVLNLKIPKELEALLYIRLYYSNFYLFTIKWYSDKDTKIKFDYQKKIYSLSVKYNYPFYTLKVLHSKAIREMIKNRFESAKELCIEGYNTASKHNKGTELFTFASMLHYLKTKTNVKNIKLNNEKILDYYHQIKKTAPLNIWTVFLENSLAMTYYPEKRKEILEVFHEQINSNCLLGDYLFAVYWRFIHDSELYYERLLSYFNKKRIEEKDYLEIEKVGENSSDYIEKTCFNTLCYQKNLNNFGFLWQVYHTQLIVSYFHESEFDYRYSKLLVNKMDRLKQKDKIALALKTYELLKLCLKMLENSKTQKYILTKYAQKLTKEINSIKINPAEFTIVDYAIISSLARRLKSKEITNMVRNFYLWLEEKHPEILAPVFRKIEEHNVKIPVIDGLKQTAA